MIICLDLETTGLDKYNDRIIEIAMVKFDEKTYEIIDTFESFVNPQTEIPDIISNITNIFNDDIIGAPVIEELKKDIINFIGNLPILGHNIQFDVDFFNNNGINIKQNILIDTFFLANFLSFNESSLNLEMLCNSFGIKFEGAHRALNDVNATIELFKKLVLKFNKLIKSKKHLLYYIFNRVEDKNIEYLRENLFNNIDSNLSFVDFEKKILKLVGKLDTEELLIVDKKVDNTNMRKIFTMLGMVEKRENQLKMTDIVMESFIKQAKTVIEAPTGLGKSFAYLIPSIIHSVKTGEKVFVSTKTKTLQDQLYNGDLVYLKEKLGIDFNYTKLKGKKNYLSIKLFFEEFWKDDISYNKAGFLSKILLWLHETKHGELDELNFFGQEYSFLRYINSDNYLVTAEKNDYRRYEFLYKARVKLESSNIIIINHSLLFSDLNTDTSVLGKIHNLIIDEGHNIEDSVTESLKIKYSLGNLLEQFILIEKIFTKIEAKKIDLIILKENLVSKLELLDDYLFSYLNQNIFDNNKYKTLLLQEDFFNDIDFASLLKKIELDFIDIIDRLAIEEGYDFTKEIGLLHKNLDSIKIMLDKESYKKYIKIITYNDSIGVGFEYTLLNPGKYLKKQLWKKLKTCILTSATLQIGGKFDYYKTLLFLDDFNFHSFESDFDYKKQAVLFIPTDIGNIKNNSTEVVSFLEKLYSIVRGEVLTLLTSYSIIRKIYTSLNNGLKKQGINLYAQGVAGSKIKLLSFFLNDPKNSILLGTDSFWEGVDIPGDDLKYLVIHKFPFSVPTDPIFISRSVFFKDPFLEYSVPKAIIKLKQGFGRLIRTKKDTGIVVLLDSRITTTNWGNTFFSAFPKEINIKKGTKSAFIDILKKKL